MESKIQISKLKEDIRSKIQISKSKEDIRNNQREKTASSISGSGKTGQLHVKE